MFEMLIYLAVLIFVVPFALALYLWRDSAPKKGVYYMCFSVSTLALLMLVLGSSALAAVMPIGLFLASTSFFAGVYLSFIVRNIREQKRQSEEGSE